MIQDHPTVRRLRAQPRPAPPEVVDGAWLAEVARQAGADDVAFVALDHVDLADERPHVHRALASAQALACFVVRTSRGPIRSPARSVANGEFHRASDRCEQVGDALVRALEDAGVPALSPNVGFPMEMDRFPERGWVVSHKLAAQAAGLGRIGLHRNLIHPRFGSFVLLGTVIVGRPIATRERQLDYNPCFECRLCVAACPVGAISADRFDFAACLSHNYREFMTGFSDLTGAIADSRDRWELREKVPQPESASWWQSLATGPSYKAAYCIAACPAGEDVIGPFLADRRGFVAEVVEPLRSREEPIYVLPDSDAEAHVRARFPHKTVRRVEGGLYVDSIRGFLRGATLTFQPKKSKDVSVVVSFRFTGREAIDATFRVDGGRLRVEDGLAPDADVTVTVDGDLWVEVLQGRRNPVWLVVTGRMRLRGDRAALDRFQGCFPGRV